MKIKFFTQIPFFQGKEHPKMGGPNSLFAGLGTPPGFPGISPLGAVDPLRSSSVTTSLNSPLITSASSGGTSSTPQLPTASSTSSTSAATPLPKVAIFFFLIMDIS